MSLQVWEKVGQPSTLASKYGKSLLSQDFRNPKTGKIVEFSFLSQKDWSIVLAITEDDQVLVVRQYKQGCDSVLDELPAGTSNFADESPEEVMKRELREETGYEAGKVINLRSCFIATRSSPTKAYCFLALGCKKVGEARMDKNEEIESRLVSLREWLDMVVDGTIIEPTSIVTTVRALPYIGRSVV